MSFSIFEMVRETAWMKGVLYAACGMMVLPVAFYAFALLVLPFFAHSKTDWADRGYRIFCRLWTVAGVCWGCLTVLLLLAIVADIARPVLESIGQPGSASVVEKALGDLFACGMLSVFFGLWVIFWTHSIGAMIRSQKVKDFGSRIMVGCVCATVVSIVALIAMVILRTAAASLVAGILLGVCAAKAASDRKKALERASNHENPIRKDDESSARWALWIAVACSVLAGVFVMRAVCLG